MIISPAFINNTGRIFFVTLTILIMRSTAFSSTYYVDNVVGNDAFSGVSIDFPWKTIDGINQKLFDPGDIILFRRGQTWKEQLIISSSGSLENPIILGAYGEGNKPIITARDAVPGWSDSSSWENQTGKIWSIHLNRDPVRLWLSGSERKKSIDANNLGKESDWFFDEINNRLLIFSSDSPATAFSRIESATIRTKAVVVDQSDYITIQNLDIRGGRIASIEVNSSSYFTIEDCQIGKDSGKFGFYALNITTDQICDNGIIKRCTIDSGLRIKYDYNYPAVTDGIKLMNGCNNWKIYENTIMDWGHSCVQIENNNPSWTTSYNEIYDNVLSAKNTAYCRGFEVVGHKDRCSYNKIYRNLIKDTTVRNQILGNRNSIYYNIIQSMKNVSYRPDGTAHAISFDGYGNYACEENELFNNVIFNCEEPGIRFADDSVIEEGNKIMNNIVYNCGVNSKDGLSGISLVIPNNDNIKLNFILNNSFYNAQTNSTISYRDNKISVSQFNLTGSNHGDNIHANIQADPEFVNITDFAFFLKQNSPCIDAGIDVGIVTDFVQSKVPLGMGVDIGAFEFGDRTPPARPSGFKILEGKNQGM